MAKMNLTVVANEIANDFIFCSFSGADQYTEVEGLCVCRGLTEERLLLLLEKYYNMEINISLNAAPKWLTQQGCPWATIHSMEEYYEKYTNYSKIDLLDRLAIHEEIFDIDSGDNYISGRQPRIANILNSYQDVD